MHAPTNALRCLALPLIILAGCDSQELPGSYFNVDRAGVAVSQGNCAGNVMAFGERLQYRMDLRGNEVTVAVGEDVFAGGFAKGCEITYDTIIWTSVRDGFTIDWQVNGTADVDKDGGTVCNANVDWQGTEVYSIVNSQHPDVSPDCQYTVEVSGRHTKTVE